MRAYLGQKISEKQGESSALRKNDNQRLNASYDVVLKLMSNQKIRDYWLYEYLLRHIDDNGIKNINGVFQKFNATCKNEEYLKKIRQLYGQEQRARQDHLVKTYKTIDGFKLDAHLFLPQGLKQGERRPATVYFHGGSWGEGKPDWHFSSCKSDAAQGMVGVSVEYRTYGRYGTQPFEAVADTKSLFRWLRLHADELHIDPDKIIALGHSAGGHLILCAAMCHNLDEPGEDLTVSSAPNALVLKAAVYDLSGPNWWDSLNEKGKSLSISPTHQIKSGLPPIVMFHGTSDNMVPYPSAKVFAEKMAQAGNDCEFHTLGGAGHVPWFDPKVTDPVSRATQAFLQKLGYLK